MVVVACVGEAEWVVDINLGINLITVMMNTTTEAMMVATLTMVVTGVMEGMMMAMDIPAMVDTVEPPDEVEDYEEVEQLVQGLFQVVV
ncbi:hypothetical protein, partial [Salmonella sp. s55004]|uniref:hypothetical protein n=1 Tax=Salmonella sp. s55004 TaxID=3159675 RepID=UPI00398138BA